MTVANETAKPGTNTSGADSDYAAILAAVMETARGRWFLAEYARRNRMADTKVLLDALGRLERLITSVANARVPASRLVEELEAALAAEEPPPAPLPDDAVPASVPSAGIAAPAQPVARPASMPDPFARLSFTEKLALFS